MRVILNSDVMYHHDRLVRDQLSAPLQKLATTCQQRGHEIVIPQTARLEFDRHQVEMAAKERQRLGAALATIDDHGIVHAVVNLDELITPQSLIDLIASAGGAVTEIAPTLADYQDAHRRAALHEAPHPPEAKSDEMRDLIIWAQALRLAREGGALLISRDKVHTHSRGDSEASAAGLVRVDSIDAVLEYFEVLTPTGELVDSILQLIWPSFAASEQRLPDPLELLAVADVRFIQGKVGLASAAARIRARGAEGQSLEASVDVSLEDGVIQSASLEGVKLGNDALPAVSIEPGLRGLDPADDSDLRLERLRKAISQ